jgi:hypothetical protein
MVFINVLYYSYRAYSYSQYVYQEMYLMKFNSQQILKLLHVLHLGVGTWRCFNICFELNFIEYNAWWI